MKTAESRFSACHPAVTFAFFCAAIVGSVFFRHPAYLLASVLSAMACLLSENGRKALPMIAGMLPLFGIISVINPLFNTGGERILFTCFGRPYTLEALIYGMVVAGTLVAALLWFFCWNAVMTSDKFTCLFGNLIPSLSLILVMVLRLIPAYRRKAAQISGARRCIGKSAAGNLRTRAEDGMTVLFSLTSWALEGAIVTADSMRSRGYGAARRTSFQVYRWLGVDIILLVLILLLFASAMAAAALGWTAAAFTPVLAITPVSGIRILGLAAYGGMLLIPTVMNAMEALKWNFFRSGI